MSEVKPQKRDITAKDVLWYIPNQIGYARVITAILSFMTMQSYPIATAFFYTTSCLLDALDGTAARKYDQCSGLGAVLDMVTDRSTTSGMMCFLCIAYPQYAVFFQILLAIDISSHYMHMYSALTGGATSHKQVSAESSKLLHLYYTNRKVLFTVCFFNECFYAGLYMMAFPDHYTFGKWITIVSTPLYLFKQFANLLQLQRAALILANIDAKAANEKKEGKK
ncbi:CDP-diacylglycerol--inositol 3-phosphatidyltransferase [Monosporozyma unispora]|nr:CDP-diacylglycerol-inositol 3-phosphatidyltransferase [Kazachstania unispora]